MIRIVLALAFTFVAFAAAAQNTNTPPAGSLSDKLEKSDGVIKPHEDVDPKIAKPAPVVNPKSTPVIPPPGAAGGRQDVQPK